MNALSRPARERSFRERASAMVIGCDGRAARIAVAGGESVARVAFGCLVRPEAGDRVLVETLDGEDWILSILERSSGAAARLFGEDRIVIAAKGSLTLTASEIAIEAASGVRVGAPAIDLSAARAHFVLDELLQVSRRAVLHVGRLRHVAEFFELLAERALTRAKDATRLVEGSDQLRAGDIDHRAAGTMQFRAETALIDADSLVRVDAAQIHMG